MVVTYGRCIGAKILDTGYLAAWGVDTLELRRKNISVMGFKSKSRLCFILFSALWGFT